VSENKWEQPDAPPPPLFTGNKEKDLVKQVTDEVIERVIGVSVLYYPISLKHSQYHPLYGEAVNKTFLPPVKVDVLAEWEGEQTDTTGFGIDKKSSVTLHFHKRRLTEDQNLFVREGDFIQYGEQKYEITSLGQPRQLFGQPEAKIEIVAKCVRARDGAFPSDTYAEADDDDPRLTAPACDPVEEIRVLTGDVRSHGGSGEQPCAEEYERPGTPPPPLFTGKKETNLVKQVNDELLERVVGQQIVYFPVSVPHSNFHELYGEAVNKTFLPPIRVFASVDWKGSDTTTSNYGIDRKSAIDVKFHKRRLSEDQNLFVREGDYVLYGNILYEIATVGQPRLLFGKIDEKFEVVASCIRAREGIFRLSEIPGALGDFDLDSVTACDNAELVSVSDGVDNTMANVGTGEGVFKNKTGTQFNMKTLIAGQDITLTSDSNEITISVSSSGPVAGIIGEAEDGSYTDGIFTDFLPSTPIGVAIDRFNEILKILAPSPAPDVSRLNATTLAGVSTKLSFGASNAIAGYIDVSSIGSFSAIDASETYESETSGSDFRRGTYDGTSNIEGVVNFHVDDDTYDNAVNNYPEDSFGNATTGSLELYLNGVLLHTIDLSSPSIGTGTPGSGTGTHLNTNGSGFIDVSEADSAEDRSGNLFNIFQHRTANYIIDTSDQTDGLNYVEVKHSGSWGYKTTNHVQWVNDSNANALTAATPRFANETGTGSKFLSGVEYFTGGTADYLVVVNNAYRNVYSTQDITFTTSNCSIAPIPFPELNTGAGEDETKQLHITGSATLTDSESLGGSINASVNVAHPLKADLSSGGSATLDGILIYDVAGSSTNLLETFNEETYRLASGDYDNQAAITAGAWNSETHMLGADDHSNGLQMYDGALYSPVNTLNSGDFRDDADGGALRLAPAGNPDYSGVSGTRTFYRYFTNSTGETKRDISLTIEGDSTTIVTAGSSLDPSKIKVFVKIPGTTGFMDVASPFVLGSTTDDDGAYVLSLDGILDATNILSFGIDGVANGDSLVIKIEADAAWAGTIDRIQVVFGAGTGTTPSEAPDLDDIDINDDGVDAKLSFGTSKPITGYESVTTSTGHAATDLNNIFSNTGDIAGIFNGSVVMDGELNEDVPSNGTSYVANSFNDAVVGTLKLEVNGTVVHTVDLTNPAVGTGSPGAGSYSTLNPNGSGFTNLSEYAYAIYSGNSVPDYTKNYRTGKYQVGLADQVNGWNYARVIHSKTSGDIETNYVEWVNDDNSDALTASDVVLDNFNGSSFYSLSGVRYFTSCSSSYHYSADNVYKNVYYKNNDAISFPTTNYTTITAVRASGTLTAASAVALPPLSTTTDSQNGTLHITGTVSFDPSESLVGTYASATHTVSVNSRVKHPLKSNLTTATKTKNNFLVYQGSETGDINSHEHMDGEEYRIQSGSYDAQSDVTDVASTWDSTVSVNNTASAGYANGLLLYSEKLISPTKGALTGDFRSVDDGGVCQAPSGNPDYSTLTNSTREYYRYFQSSQVGDVSLATVTIYGDANLVAKGGAFNLGTPGANKDIHIEVKIPGDTGWLDLARPASVSEDITQDVGGFNGGGTDVDQTIDSGGTSYGINFRTATLNGTSGGTADYLVIRVTAHEDWTGHLERISFTYGT